jgi:probable rRNA maturation factor
MQIDLEINNTTESPVADIFFETVARKTLEKSGYDFLQNQKVEISLALVTEKEIKRLNKDYRQHNSVTDVLSFPEYQNGENIKKAVSKNNTGSLFLGELILCYDDIWRYANNQGLKIEKELAEVFVHGILHLLGFGHGTKMFLLQQKIAEEAENNV